MRVLHITSGNLYGGVERILVTLGRYAGFCQEMEQHFAVCFAARLSNELTQAGAPVHILGDVRTSRPFTVLRARRRLNDLLLREQFDVAICHMSWAHAIFAPVIIKRRIPVVFYMHNRVTGTHWTQRWASMTPPALVLCVSKDTAATCDRLFPGVPQEVFYSPLPAYICDDLSDNDDVRREVRTELDTSMDAAVIIQVSRMESWKGHDTLLEALGSLRHVPDWTCWIVGGAQTPSEAKYLAQLQGLSARLEISKRVRFLGERKDVMRLLRAADIFCQPNRQTEGFSLAFMEAFLASRPIVTTGIGGALEIVDESCGALLAPEDSERYASVLRELIQNPQERFRKGAAGHQKVLTMCDPRTQMQRLHQLLQNCVCAAGNTEGIGVTAGGHHRRSCGMDETVGR